MELKKNPIVIACVIICIVIGTGIVITLLQSQDTAIVHQLPANQTVGTPVPPVVTGVARPMVWRAGCDQKLPAGASMGPP